MSVTIKDIARLANVSHTTVSRALNDSPLINPKTKQRIQTIAKELHYSPNYSAKSLVLDRSYNIGLFFSTLHSGTTSGFFHEIVRGVNAVVKDRYNLVVKGIDEYKDFRGITPKSFDGIIVMSQSAQDDPFIGHALARGIPVVVLNRHVENAAITNILSDDREGSRSMVEYLIKSGHRRIAIIEGKRGFSSTQLRKEGYLQALSRYGIPALREYQAQGDYDFASGYTAMRQLLLLEKKPTAVFCSNDDMAVGAMKAIAEQGMKVPDDISVAGFDENRFSAFLSPALTTVKRPLERISRKGAETLLEAMEHKQMRKRTLYMNTELVIRQSVGKAKE